MWCGPMFGFGSESTITNRLDAKSSKPNQTDFKPSFINSPDSAEAAEESLANSNGAQLLCQPIKDHQFKPAKGGVNELCVCYSLIPLTLALFLPLYSSFP